MYIQLDCATTAITNGQFNLQNYFINSFEVIYGAWPGS